MRLATSLLDLAGLGLIVAGVYLVLGLAAALIVAGVALLLASWRLATA